MLRDGNKPFDHGFPQDAWSAAKAEAKAVLIEYARRRQMIVYSDLVKKIKAITIHHHDPRLFHFLGEVSTEEFESGRPLLTALVVHK